MNKNKRTLNKVFMADIETIFVQTYVTKNCIRCIRCFAKNDDTKWSSKLPKRSYKNVAVGFNVPKFARTFHVYALH